MRAADTNVLVRILTRDNPGQTEAADAWIAKGAFVPMLALAETVWVLERAYGFVTAQQAEAVEKLLSHQDLILEGADVVREALQLFRRHHKVGFSDCLMLASTRKAGHTPLGTFDRHLARVPGVQRL